RPTASVLFDHLVGGGEQRVRQCHVQCSCRLEVDDKLELGRAFDRQIGRVGAVQNLGNVDTDTTIEVDEIGPIGHQAAAVGKGAKLRDARDTASWRGLCNTRASLAYQGRDDTNDC